MSDRRPTAMDIDEYDDTELQNMYGRIFTPDRDHLSLSTSLVQHQQAQVCYSNKAYQSRTLSTHNYIRRTILPAYPPSSMLTTSTTTQSTDGVPDLLLCNVPISMLNLEQSQRRQLGTYVQSFVFNRWDLLRRYKIDSFMSELYENFYSKLQQQWHIDMPIIDYNLARMKKLAEQKQLAFLFDELPLALEFYLQMDVDMFHWKTCSIRGTSPRMVLINGLQQHEGIFDATLEEPKPRYCIQRCKKSNCLCCHSSYPRRQPVQTSAVQFDTYRIHTFVHGYDAVLNGPVTCETCNLIYVLTCPCGKYDYVAHTNQSFADCLTDHRIEGHRAIREYLLGDAVVNHLRIESQLEPKTKDPSWLYEHSTRCSKALQLFLDYNPMYWCFIPTTKHTRKSGVLETAIKLSSTVPVDQRKESLVDVLVKAIPTPPADYLFTPIQREQQKLFFKFGYDRHPVTPNTVDLYNATVVAVLPNCSPTMKRFVECLFITHAECQLNEYGQFIGQSFLHSFPFFEQWWQNLIDRPLSITF